ESAVPAGTFPSFMAEGTQLGRRGEHGKALACFNNALQLRAGDKHCLVARSKCYLKLGDTENALKDAEASLENDKTFSKGLYQKAETLYTMGDFEFALVFYHRGHRLRPDLEKFTLGIEKCQEAILNCIGSPSSVRLEKKELCFVSLQAELRKANEKAPSRLSKDQSWTKKEKAVRNPRREKQLLGELYADKVYLEKLLKDKDLMESSTRQGLKVAELVCRAISYLQARRELWQQQEPRQRGSSSSPRGAAEPGTALLQPLRHIQSLLAAGCPEESCRRAEHLLAAVAGWPQEAPNKIQVLAKLHSCIGDAQLELGQLEAALQSHSMDLQLARQGNLAEATSRALGNIGRVCARAGKFQQAIDSWEQKIPMAQSSLEKAWLFHELGQCYLQLNQAEAAQIYGQKSLQAADEEGDAEWQLRAALLLAQTQVKVKDYWSAILSLEKALEKAKVTRNKAAQKDIMAALDNVSKSFLKELEGRGDEATVYSLKDFDSSSESRKGDNVGKEREESEQSTESQEHGKQKEGARSSKEAHGSSKEGEKEAEDKEKERK
ncbi:TTC25 protein, partial [Bucco capensis]|nr:TTC25 protein [Bucco capensis]